jgi:hypothetical protein
MDAAGGYVETASDRAAKATADLENAMTSLGETFAPLIGASDSLWNSIKIGAINALNTAVKPLIQALSEAGTLGQGARATAGFGNLGGNSKVDRMIGRLGNGKTAGAYSIYQQQLGEFDKYINNKRFQIAAYGGDNSSVAQSAKARLQTELDGALKMREEYVKRAQELHNKVPSPFEPATTSGGATGGGRSGGGGPSMPKNIRWDNYADKAALAAVKAPDIEGGSEAWNTMREAITGCKEGLIDFSAETANWEKNFDPVLKYQEKMNKALEEQQARYNLAGQAAQNFGAALQGIEDPSARAAGTVIQAISSIALGFAMASSNANTAGTGWGWLAWLAAGTAAMATTISTIHSLTGYAEGGIVGGTSYSGDNIPIMANAGELVLTKAQQNTLAQNLQSGGMGSMNLKTKVKGTELLVWLDNSLAQSGRGELVTWGQ